MRRHLLTPLFALTLFLGFAAVGEACLFKWLFGHHHRHHGGFGASPVIAPQATFFGPSACGAPALPPVQQTFFRPREAWSLPAAPVQQTFYGPSDVCAPPMQQTFFGPTDTCACPLPGDGPALGSPAWGNNGLSPVPYNQSVPRTFEYEPEAGTLPDDNGFEPRRRSPDEEREEADEFGGTRASNRPNAPDTVIRRKEPAPAGVAPASDEGPEDDGLLFVPLNLDDKITWRPVTERTRVEVQASYSSPAVARAKVRQNQGWTPVDTPEKLVSK